MGVMAKPSETLRAKHRVDQVREDGHRDHEGKRVSHCATSQPVKCLDQAPAGHQNEQRHADVEKVEHSFRSNSASILQRAT
jgi:hypothetical protein